MTMTELLSRLRSECTELSEIEEVTRINPRDRSDYPVASIHRASEAPSGEMGGHTIVARQYEVRVTASHDAELGIARQQINSALVDWRPSGAAKPFRWIGGEMLALSGPNMQWRDRYEVSFCSNGE